MTTGVDGGTTGSLIIRKGTEGLTVDGDPPRRHTFPEKFLERELNAAVRVHVIIPGEPRVTYEVVDFDRRDLVCGLLSVEYTEVPDPPEQKRHWFRRKKD